MNQFLKGILSVVIFFSGLTSAWADVQVSCKINKRSESNYNLVHFFFSGSDKLLNSNQAAPENITEFIYWNTAPPQRRETFEVESYRAFSSGAVIKTTVFNVPGGSLTLKFDSSSRSDKVRVIFVNPRSPNRPEKYNDCEHLRPEAGVTAHN